MGNTWTARSKTGEIIKTGCLVRVDAIDGVKLIVVPVNADNNNIF
jgi:membrane protein implicated in regulation of membrane protease activity